MSQRQISIVAAALLLSNAMVGMDGTIISTALPAIVSDLHAIEYMGWIVAVFLLGMATATPLWSKLGERIGNKKTYQIATLIFVAGAIFQAISGNIVFFLIARGLMGIGAGGMLTMPFIIYANLYKDIQKRAKIVAYATASFSIASIIGPLIGGLIVDYMSWHWVFYINIPIAAVSVLVVQIFFKESVKTVQRKKIDYWGAVTLIAGLLTLLTGIQMTKIASLESVASLIFAGMALLILFFKIESKAMDPIIPTRIFKNTALVIDFVLFAILWGAFIAFNIYAPLWVQGLYGLSALIGGMTQIPGAFTNFAGSVMAASINPRLGKYRVIILGTLAFIVAFGIMVLGGMEMPLWLILLSGAFQGLGLGLCFNVLQIGVQEDVEKRDVPVATSCAFLIRILSQTFMASIYGEVLNSSLVSGVAQSNGRITMFLLNQMSDSKTSINLPGDILPLMRSILYDGLHNIMILVLVLLVISLLFSLGAQRFHSKR